MRKLVGITRAGFGRIGHDATSMTGAVSASRATIFKLTHYQLWRQTKVLNDNVDQFKKKWGEQFGFTFLPLVYAPLVDRCSIDILFLRRDYPGSVVKHGGAVIDAREQVKVLEPHSSIGVAKVRRLASDRECYLTVESVMH